MHDSGLITRTGGGITKAGRRDLRAGRVEAAQTAANTHQLGKANHPAGQSAAAHVRQQLDRLDIGQDVTHVAWSGKKRPIPLPPSALPLPPV